MIFFGLCVNRKGAEDQKFVPIKSDELIGSIEFSDQY